MRKFILVIVLILVLIGFLFTTPMFKIRYIAQNEIGFKYNVSDGKAVAQKNNPLLPFGYAIAIGWDSRFFIINSEVNNYNFTSKRDVNSPYDESLSWDSSEGVTMSVDYTILGRVTDPWQFYNNFGQGQYSYRGVEGIQDKKIYEAIRLAGEFVDVRMGELTQHEEADLIRRNPRKYTETLTKEAAEYAEQFGFTVTDVLFPDRFVFPGGNTIQKSRGMLQAANSDFEKKKNEKKTAEQERNESIANAEIEADKVVAEGQREANHLLSEAKALAEQFRVSVDDIGVEGTMQITMSKLQGNLMRKGVIREAVLTQDSLFGKPFYSVK